MNYFLENQDYRELENYLEKNADIVDWEKISEYKIVSRLSFDFIDRFKEELEWKNFIFNPGWKRQFIKRYLDKFLEEEERFFKYFAWKMPDSFIKKNLHKMNLEEIIASCYVSEHFLEKFYVPYAGDNQKLWDKLWMDQEVSMKFIQKYIKFVNWTHISTFHNLTLDFIKENFDKLNIDLLLENYHLKKKDAIFIFREASKKGYLTNNWPGKNLKKINSINNW